MRQRRKRKRTGVSTGKKRSPPSNMKNFDDATENEENAGVLMADQDSFAQGILSPDEESRFVKEDLALRQIKSSAQEYPYPPHGGYDIYMNHPPQPQFD
jgi:hypothetical protein